MDVGAESIVFWAIWMGGGFATFWLSSENSSEWGLDELRVGLESVSSG